MAEFTIAFNKTIQFEGGYSNNPNDKGNWYDGRLIGSNYGISACVLADYINGEIIVTDMKYLSLSTAEKIYQQNYWNKIQGDNINNQTVANILFDTSVNIGVGRAIKMAQTLLNLISDGIAGLQTLSALNVCNNDFVDNYKTARISYYKNIVASNPSQAQFLKGWINRVNKF